MVKRQFPNPVELAKLMRFKAPELNLARYIKEGTVTEVDNGK